MSGKSLIVFTTAHPWIQGVVNEIKPDEFDVAFLDVTDRAEVERLLPLTDFIVCLKLPTWQAKLLTRCRLVMHNGVGYDGIDRATLHAMGIPVAITPVMTPEGVAEHVVLLTLALYKQMPAVRASMVRGEFDMLGWRNNSHNLAGKTLGIVGLGRIGKRVARLAQAFGCTTIYTDIVDISAEFEQKYDLERVSLDALIERSDVITVHVPLTELTEGMFGEEEFGRMKSGSVLINASRGPTYDLDALYEAVNSGHLYGAGIDVFDPEPPSPEHPIFTLDNVVFTPHIASGTVERQYAINAAQFANAQRVLGGLPPENEIPF